LGEISSRIRRSRKRKMKIVKLYIILLGILFIGCENELDMYDEYTELPVVYGLINPSNSQHIIRINKTFMPNSNPADALANHNLKCYESIEGFVEEWNENTLIKTFELTPYDGIDNPYLGDDLINPLYSFSTTLNPNYSYKLNLITPTSTSTITADTHIIGKLEYFYSQQFFVDFSTDEKRAVVRWRAPKNATIFILSFKFDYYEVINGDTSLHTIRQTLFDDRYRSFDDNDPLVTVITGKVFYDMIKENIPIKENVSRIATPPKFEINMGGEELYDLIISAALKDLDFPIYENGQYTNLTHGLGIFTSVYDTTIVMKYNSRTLDTLSLRDDMKIFNFRNFVLE
jgi:hypothetical protein